MRVLWLSWKLSVGCGDTPLPCPGSPPEGLREVDQATQYEEDQRFFQARRDAYAADNTIPSVPPSLSDDPDNPTYTFDGYMRIACTTTATGQTQSGGHGSVELRPPVLVEGESVELSAVGQRLRRLDAGHVRRHRRYQHLLAWVDHEAQQGQSGAVLHDYNGGNRQVVAHLERPLDHNNNDNDNDNLAIKMNNRIFDFIVGVKDDHPHTCY